MSQFNHLSDIRNHFTEISKVMNETSESILHPNAESYAAMAEAERISHDASVKGYRDMNALFEDLNATPNA